LIASIELTVKLTWQSICHVSSSERLPQGRELSRKKINMVEPLLSGIVLGMIPVTLSGLFVTAYLQYRRGDQLNF